MATVSDDVVLELNTQRKMDYIATRQAEDLDAKDKQQVAILKVEACESFPDGKEFPIYTGINLIGRGDNVSIQLNVVGISSIHAIIDISPDGKEHFVEDLHSTNGTRWNSGSELMPFRLYQLLTGKRVIFEPIKCIYKVLPEFQKLIIQDDFEEYPAVILNTSENSLDMKTTDSNTSSKDILNKENRDIVSVKDKSSSTLPNSDSELDIDQQCQPKKKGRVPRPTKKETNKNIVSKNQDGDVLEKENKPPVAIESEIVKETLVNIEPKSSSKDLSENSIAEVSDNLMQIDSSESVAPQITSNESISCNSDSASLRKRRKSKVEIIVPKENIADIVPSSTAVDELVNVMEIDTSRNVETLENIEIDSIPVKKAKGRRTSNLINKDGENAVDEPKIEENISNGNKILGEKNDFIEENIGSIVQDNTTSKEIRILFTGLENEEREYQESLIKELGGKVVNDWQDCTHLITDKVRRTIKFLCALSTGKYIMNTKWLTQCAKKKEIVPESKFLLSDKPSEKKWGFNLQKSIKESTLLQTNNKLLFDSYIFHPTSSVVPPQNELEEILIANGGKLLPQLPNKLSPEVKEKLIIIGNMTDFSEIKKLIKEHNLKQSSIQSNECILSSILKMDFNPTFYQLKYTR